MSTRKGLLGLLFLMFAIIVAGAVTTFLQLKETSNIEQEKTKLESRLRNDELVYRNESAQINELNIEKLEWDLAQIEGAAPIDNPLPSEEAAIAVTNDIVQYSLNNKVAIIQWNNHYDIINVGGANYNTINHDITVMGTSNAINNFLSELVQAPTATTIKYLNVTNKDENLWNMRLELTIPFS